MESDYRSANPAYRRDIVEIDLLDLAKVLLKHWKKMVILGVIFAIAGGAFGAYKGYKDFGTAEEARLEKYQNEYDTYEAALRIRNGKIEAYEYLFDNIELLKDMRKRREDFLEKSVYLNLDPYNVAENTVLWKVTADQDVKDFYKDSNIDPADEIVNAYALTGSKAINWDKIGKEMDMDPGTIPDLVSLYADTGANQVVLRVLYKDEAGAAKISEMVREQIEEEWKKTASGLPGHKMMMNPPVARMTSNTAIEDARKASTDAINIYNDKITVLRNKLDTMKNPYETEEPEEPKDATKSGSVKKSVAKGFIKFGLIGFLVGCFIICAIYGCKYLFSGAIHTASELRDYFFMEILADLTEKNPPRQELVKRCAYLAEGRSGGERIFITGTAPEEEIIELTREIKNYLPKLVITDSRNLLTDSSVISEINDKTDIILVEKRHLSKRDNIAEELKCIRDRKGTLLGGVVV